MIILPPRPEEIRRLGARGSGALQHAGEDQAAWGGVREDCGKHEVVLHIPYEGCKQDSTENKLLGWLLTRVYPLSD